MMMSGASRGLKVERGHGEQFRKALIEMGIFDSCRKITSDEFNVYLPVLEMDEQAAAKLRQIAKFELEDRCFRPEKHNPSPEELLGFRPSFDVVGDIAIVEDIDAERVAHALMSCNKSIRAVIAPVSDVEGEFRTRRFRHVAGDVRTITTHKEHGLCYRMDLEGVYFTPRLGTERLRIANQIRPNDVVLDMFAGVGPFALLMAKRKAKVIAMDKNPVAVKYLRENARKNKIDDIEILEGDANELALRYVGIADHVIMNLPHSASQFLIPAIEATKSKGIVHYYAIAPEEDLFRDWTMIASAAEQIGVGVEVTYQGVVRSYAPRRFNVVIDFRVSR